MSHRSQESSNTPGRSVTGDSVVAAALRTAARGAEAVSEAFPPVDVPAILAEATKHPAMRHPAAPGHAADVARPLEPSAVRTWVLRAAVAAACMAAALAALVLTRPTPLPQSEVPAYVAELVNDLYDDGDYVHDQLSPFLRITDTMDDSYLDDVWASVIRESSAAPNLSE